MRLAGINVGGPAGSLAASSTPSPNTDNVPRGDFGLIGLAVMGQNLILNAADHGFNVVAFNRTVSKVDHFLANEAKGESSPRQQSFPGAKARKLTDHDHS